MTKIKKILFFNTSLSSGGAERVMSVLSNYFVELGINVTIALLCNNKVNYELRKEIDIVAFKEVKYKKFAYIKRNLHRLMFTKKVIRDYNPDIVISFDPMCNIITAIMKKIIKFKLIISERNDPHFSPIYKSERILRKLVYHYADGFIFQTVDAKNYYSKKITEKSCIIANPIKEDLPEVSRTIIEKKICGIGRLNKQKNFPLLLNAFAKMNDKVTGYTLHIFGEGKELEYLKQISNRLNISDIVVFEGVKKDIHYKIKNMSMFVLSSDYEGMSNALIECMGLGIPCISTDCPIGGSRFLIKNGINGILVPVGDVSALSNAMIEIAVNSDLAKQISIESQKIRDTCSVNEIGNKYLKFSEQIINGQI